MVPGSKFLPLFLLVVAPVMARTARAQAADTIHADIAGLHNDKGHVLCAIFSTPADFPRQAEKAVARTSAVIGGGHAVCEFTGIRPGRYAISVIHDENDNGKLDTKIFGIPREGVGASNDARGHFGPPRFEDAVFQFGGGRLDLKITVAYL
jgi:uncharacterized protein (DUF2141 family)